MPALRPLQVACSLLLINHSDSFITFIFETGFMFRLMHFAYFCQPNSIICRHFRDNTTKPSCFFVRFCNRFHSCPDKYFFAALVHQANKKGLCILPNNQHTDRKASLCLLPPCPILLYRSLSPLRSYEKEEALSSSARCHCAGPLTPLRTQKAAEPVFSPGSAAFIFQI